MHRILIVDDDENLCKSLKEIFDEEGYEAEYVTSSEEALERVGSDNYDIVITDLVMPKTSGMELLAYIKGNYPHTEVVMITAFGSVENAVKAMKKGAAEYIEKPLKLGEIKTSIGRVLEESKFKKKYHTMLEDVTDEQVGRVLKNIANPIRRKSLYILYSRGKMSFTNIKNELLLEDPTKLSFHLRQLKGSELVAQDSVREYYITARGEKIIELLRGIGAV